MDLAGDVGVLAMDVALIAEMAPDPMVLIDAELTGLWANQAAEDLFGWDRRAWVGRSVVPLVHPDDLATALLSVDTVQRKAVGTAVEIRVRDAAGGYRWVEVRGRSALEIPGIDGIVLVIRDLTDRRRWEVAHGDPGLFQTIVQQAPSITLLLDTSGRVRSGSRALTRVLGYGLEHIEGRELAELTLPAERHELAQNLGRASQHEGVYRFETRLVHATGGGSVPFEVSTVNLSQDEVLGGIVASLHDVTALDRARSNLEHLATHDGLTGLANRALLIEHLGAALNQARRQQRDVTLFFIDLDGFKAVNDRFGHQAGDHLLKRVATALRDVLRSADMVARFGGDEFVVLAPDTGTDAAVVLADRIKAAVSGCHELGADITTVGASIGFAVSHNGAGNSDELLRKADDAMYAIKATHKLDAPDS